MKSGDMVRFPAPHWLWKGFRPKQDLSNCPTLIGLLIEYHTWEKVATVMYEGELIRVAASLQQKRATNAPVISRTALGSPGLAADLAGLSSKPAA